MNIKEAKEYIKETVSIYLSKDEFDEYEMGVMHQRPIFLLGAPGVGKTAIMEQVSEELGVALVSYSMTHHTRQSALGLPVIHRKTYGGKEVEVTEYTLSEIIASMHDVMEETGIKEGILFLDEINCVSETLAPSMLQFLQYKEFGNHKIPEGWVVVTAGNPPEFNKSVREFDVVVMDRLKVLEVEPSYEVFKNYAMDKGIHPAVISFLDLNREYFYRIENTVNGRSYVTARGWEDLSLMLQKYEQASFEVSEGLIEQYIRNETVVKEFTAYYELYQKYRKEYGISDILNGEYSDGAIAKAKKAPFDERLSLVGMIMDKIIKEMKDCVILMDRLSNLAPIIKKMTDVSDLPSEMLLISEKMRKNLVSLSKAGTLSKDKENNNRFVIKFLESERSLLLENDGDYEMLKAHFNEKVLEAKEMTVTVLKRLHNAFEFINSAFEGGNELLIFVTNLTVNNYSSVFLLRYPSPDYEKYNKELMLEEKKSDLKSRIEDVLI